MASRTLPRDNALYADFDKDLTLHPITSDVTSKKNEFAVKESIQNLILTSRGERLFQPNIGSDIRAVLFENFTPETLNILKTMITDTIIQYEPRAELLNVSVTGNDFDHQVNASITFMIRPNENATTLNVLLGRVR